MLAGVLPQALGIVLFTLSDGNLPCNLDFVIQLSTSAACLYEFLESLELVGEAAEQEDVIAQYAPQSLRLLTLSRFVATPRQ